MNPVLRLRRRLGLTQNELAHLGGTSQPTIAAYESGSKSPTVRTLSRLAEATGMELDIRFSRPMPREDRRSLTLHEAIGTRLRIDPAAVLAKARRNLATMRERHPQAHRLLDQWELLLDLPVDDLFDVMTSPSPWARDLRQVTPFAGVLTPTERTEAYRHFRTEEAS